MPARASAAALFRLRQRRWIFDKIGIVGLGLIGGSIALAARQLWPSALVIGVDNKDVLETAMRLHAIDVAADDLIVLAEADLVILAAPVKTNVALLAELGTRTVTSPAVDHAAYRQHQARHRMAAAGVTAGALHLRRRASARRRGAGRSGERAARSVSRPAVAPDAGFMDLPADGARAFQASESGATKLTEFVAALGAVPRVISVQAHDRLLAFLSHLPQPTATRADAGGRRRRSGLEGLALAGRGLADTTRLASSPPEIWRDIAATNADEIGPALDALIELLQELRRDLRGGRSPTDVFTQRRPLARHAQEIEVEFIAWQPESLGTATARRGSSAASGSGS